MPAKDPSRPALRLVTRLQRTIAELMEEHDQRAAGHDAGFAHFGVIPVEAHGDRGIYVAVFHLACPSVIRVGRLGRFRFEAGLYLYVGSAQRHLTARLQRHSRRDKPCRWHIDYLSKRATMLGALTVAGSKTLECRAAHSLAAKYPRPVARFGSSDCRCRSHLFYVPAAE